MIRRNVVVDAGGQLTRKGQWQKGPTEFLHSGATQLPRLIASPEPTGTTSISLTRKGDVSCRTTGEEIVGFIANQLMASLNVAHSLNVRAANYSSVAHVRYQR